MCVSGANNSGLSSRVGGCFNCKLSTWISRLNLRADAALSHCRVQNLNLCLHVRVRHLSDRAGTPAQVHPRAGGAAWRMCRALGAPEGLHCAKATYSNKSFL